MATVAYFVVLPLLAVLLGEPWPLLGHVFDIPALLVPVLTGASRHSESRKAQASFPVFMVLRILNTIMFLEARWSEVIRRRRLDVYEKGH